jgi:hypothetical protein
MKSLELNHPARLGYFYAHTVKLGYSNIGFCDTMSIATIDDDIVTTEAQTDGDIDRK